MTKTSSSKGVSFDPRCAVFYSFGTLVEVAELAGQFAAEEMASFCSSLEPVSMAAVHMDPNYLVSLPVLVPGRALPL